MSDFEKFSEYWEQAVNGLVYRVNALSSPVVTHSQIQTIWHEELLTRRFLSTGLKHGARVFLDELVERNPKAAAAIGQTLRASVMPVGAETANIAGSACVTAAGIGLANVEKLPTPIKAASLVISSVFAVKTTQGILQGNKGKLAEEIEKEAARQLEAYRALLEA